MSPLLRRRMVSFKMKRRLSAETSVDFKIFCTILHKIITLSIGWIIRILECCNEDSEHGTWVDL